MSWLICAVTHGFAACAKAANYPDGSVCTAADQILGQSVSGTRISCTLCCMKPLPSVGIRNEHLCSFLVAGNVGFEFANCSIGHAHNERIPNTFFHKSVWRSNMER